MAAQLINDWWLSPEWSDVGPAYNSASTEQQHNADKVYSVFHALGWTDNAIAAMVGNMQLESGLDPACSYPKIGNTFATIDNQHATSYPDNAYGLVQWKGRGSTDPNNNQLVGYAMRHGSEWYEGDIQMERMTWEYQNNQKFHAQTVDGVYYTFSSFASSTGDPQQLAKVWMTCYEGTYSKLPERKSNAQYWYDYFSGGPTPPTPTDWIPGTDFSTLALAYDPAVTGHDIPYSQMDCIAFVNKVWQDIPVVSQHSYSLPGGTNTFWRENTSQYPNLVSTYNTTSPDGQNPTPVLWWKGTISECEAQFGSIPAGTLLFHQISDQGPPAIPSQYAGDGIGNFAHVGIYCGNNEVMQSGGRDSSSVPGGGVHKSVYDASAWNYAAFVVYVDCTGTGPTPPPPPPPTPWIQRNIYILLNQRKKVVKNVRKTI